MASLRPRLAGIAGATVIAAGLLLGSSSLAMAKSAYPAYTCNGGSITPGTYSKLTVNGICRVDLGDVSVGGDVNIRAGAELIVAYSGDDLMVGHNINVGHGAVLILGCEPDAFPCWDTVPVAPVKPFTVGPSTTTPVGPTASGWVGGSLNADQALAVLVHNSRFGHDVSVKGGGGGPQGCDEPAPAPVRLDSVILPFGTAYFGFEDSWVGGNVKVERLNTCWSGFIRNWVGGDVNWNWNMTSDPDGNEIGWNWIGDDLNCRGNDAAPHFAPEVPFGSIVIDHATGQCVDLTTDSFIT